MNNVSIELKIELKNYLFKNNYSNADLSKWLRDKFARDENLLTGAEL